MIDIVAVPGLKKSAYEQNETTTVEQHVHVESVPTEILQEIRNLVASGWVEEIIVRSENRPRQLYWLVAGARLAGRRLRLAGEILREDLPPSVGSERWIRDKQSWVLIPPRRPRPKLLLKRAIDLIGAITLLALCLPVLLAVSVAVKLSSEGPVFHALSWHGENGRPFTGFKFRTMVRDADRLKPGLLHLNERRGPVFKIARDPRVTPVGRWLRKYSLDELPQLVSVVTGHMSLVGPRPPMTNEYAAFELWQMRKLSVKPGLTCLWQIEGRSTITDFADWARLDLKYIDNWSLTRDLAIMLRTVAVVFQGTGT